MKILLVDDDYLALDGLRQMLHWDEFSGELTGCASNGAEAVDLILHSQPDVVISDIKMPEMDGLDLAKYLYENFPKTHMILLSGHSEFQYAQKALRYRVSDYILKPITRQKILELNRQLCALSGNLDTKKTVCRLAYDSRLKEQILHILRSGDTPALHRLFTSGRIFDALCCDAESTLGIQLLNYLFLYREEIGADRSALSEEKHQQMEEYRRLSSSPERIAYLSDHYTALIEYAETQKAEYDRPIIASCLQAIDSRFRDPIFNISSLADSLHLSPPYISTVFKQAAGQTISSYLAEKRILHAKELLCDISIPIKDVSLRSGYEDPRYFARSFKKHTGMTPSEYRNLHSAVFEHPSL